VKEFLNSKDMKQIFVYLKHREYIEAFKSMEPTVDNETLEIYKLFFIILNNEEMINLFDTSIDKFWKKMTGELVRKSFDGEHLSKYIYKMLSEQLNFNAKNIIRVNYVWKKYYENKYDIKDITRESPTTGIFLLIIKEYLAWCGIIESDKNNYFNMCIILKNDILNIDKKIADMVNFYNKINNI